MTGVRVPFAGLGRAAAAIRAELDAAIAGVLDSGWFVLGEQVRAFEREFAAWCGAAHAVGVASGTDAIEIALRAAGIGRGDEVVTQANTCVPTVAAIARAGATPVLCDVDPATALIDPDSMARAIGPRTRAVVPVHLYGQCADLDAVASVAGDHGVMVIEDCAQAHGAEHRGRHAGTVGAMGCFSFYPTKNLGALGDGGAVVTGDEGLAGRLRMLRQYGQTDRYHHAVPGINSRLDELQAAVLRVRLAHLADGNARRRSIAEAYTAELAGTGVAPLPELPERHHAHHLYVVCTEERDRFQAAMERHGVATLIHYPIPIHRQPGYRELADGPVGLGGSERLAERVVSLPLYPELSDEEARLVAEAAQAAASSVG